MKTKGTRYTVNHENRCVTVDAYKDGTYQLQDEAHVIDSFPRAAFHPDHSTGDGTVLAATGYPDHRIGRESLAAYCARAGKTVSRIVG
jgi:hypothetical protein